MKSYELTVDSHKAYSAVENLLHYLLLVHTQAKVTQNTNELVQFYMSTW